MSNYLGFTATSDPEYFFLSYSNSAVTDISEIVIELSSNGVPMWYDNGLEYGMKWKEQIACKIHDSKAVLLFFTKDLLTRKSYVNNEFEMAVENFKKKVYVIMVDEIYDDEVPPEVTAWWNEIRKLQNINVYKYGNARDKANEILRAIRSDISNISIQIPPPPKPKSRDEEKISVLLKNANDMLVKAKDCDRAKTLYNEVINFAPTNPFGWFGLAKVVTNNFSNTSVECKEQAQKHVYKALDLASENDAKSIKTQWNEYINKFNTFQRNGRSRINHNNAEIDLLTNKNNELAGKIKLYKYGKVNCFTVLWYIAKLLISVAIAFGMLIGFIYVWGIYSVPKLTNNMFLIVIVGILSRILTFAIPGFTFSILYKKFVKRNISKATQLKIDAAEKEYSDNQVRINQLMQENKQMYSLL